MQPDLLHQLKDVQLPQPISGWPLAPGWYVLLVLLLGLIGVGVVMMRRRLAKKRRQQRIWQQFLAIEAQQNVATAMAYIKQVAITLYPNQQVEQLQGEAWVEFLQASAKLLVIPPELKHALAHAAYQATPANSQALLTVLHSWLEQQSC